MIKIECPKCKYGIVRRPKDGYYVDFDLRKANENVTCPNCKRTISYSIQKRDKE